MTFINILLGLIGLGIVVFFHELGHFLAARLVGINVDAFSIGWGKPILKKKVGLTEYRLGMFPIGGYCKMQGESDYSSQAYENLSKGIKPQKGDYLASTPAQRILVSFAGPFFNLIFAIFLFSIIWGVGFDVTTAGNKIILASELIPEQTFPADASGLKTGDRIIKINKQQVNYFYEINENIALNPKKNLQLTVDRDGEILLLNVVPSLEKNGAGRIGVFYWIEPVIESVVDDSPAFIAGLRAGDKIISANGIPVRNSEEFRKIRSQNPEKLIVEYERYGTKSVVEFDNLEENNELGFSWEIIRFRTPRLSIPMAIATGVKEGYKILTRSILSLRVLFMGIDLTEAVSGPVRITYMMGDVATQGFGQGVERGFNLIFNFLALISIALCVMNLLPLPILDGGMMILFLVEMIRKKPIPPKAIGIFQTCGIVIIICLMALALFGDIMFFARGLN